jgi:putative nucleotidyltransferase with HDIG domain
VNVFEIVRAKHNLVFKVGMVFVVSWLIAAMLPDTDVKGHKIDAYTSVWPYADLSVSGDFYLEKSMEELKEEREKIRASAPLFFTHETLALNSANAALLSLKKIEPAAYNDLAPILESLYSAGVFETVDSMCDKSLLVNRDNYAVELSCNDVYTLEKAVERLKRDFVPKHPELNYFDYLVLSERYNKNKTAQVAQSRLNRISLYKQVIRDGTTLIKQGETITNQKRSLVNAYYSVKQKNNKGALPAFMARWLLVFVIGMILLVFLAFFRTAIFGQNKHVAFLFLLLLASVACTAVFYHFNFMVYALPYALVPILVRVFFDSRSALFTHLMVVLCCSFFMADKLAFILLELLTGIGTLFAVAEMRKRQQILNAALLVLVFNVLVFFAYQTGFGASAAAFKLASYVPFCLSALLVLLAYPIIFITERLFGFISDFKLLELTDLNHPLLRILSTEVPGTFQHSLQVANLAEEAIYYIGGNSLLIRAGAMYHDIGKIKNPGFFIENQNNAYSPHMELNPLESAAVIINHVIHGVELAKEYRLPEQIIDFIRTHHGTTSVKYFYNLFQQQEGDSALLSEEKFHYPGPVPFSKETAVLMIADGVEAASRSLKVHDAASINDLVDRIIDYKIANNQFINANITFKDITVIKKIFKKRLMTIYHARIEYPD